jgi:hypothetical protein
MKYQHHAGVAAARSNRSLTIALTCACVLLLSRGALLSPALAATPPARADIPAVLEQARDYQLRFRDGELEAVTASVAMLEKATAAQADNADLWYALGLGYVNVAARATMPGGNRADLAVALQKGMPALNRALQIDPDHAEALSLRAGMRALMGMQMKSPELLSQALADMNRAIERAPASAAVRLTRAFGAPVMPEELRNRVNEAADLDFLIERARGNRAGNFMAILRADLHVENGELDNARQLYQVVDRTGAASAAQLARSRLALLAQDRDALMKDIKALRAVAGTQCRMCHGRTD